MLREIKDPGRHTELIWVGNAYTTKNGWRMEGFTDKHGTTYERAQRGAGHQRVTRWFKLEEGLVNAQEAFGKRLHNIRGHIREIQVWLEKKSESIPAQHRTWADVGDLGRLQLDLGAILEYLHPK